MARKKKKPTYKLANTSMHQELEDVRGKVKVMIRAVGDDGLWLKGNISKTFTVNNARVSELARDIGDLLSG